MRKLNVAHRIDEDGRVLASDGRKEYEVTVDLTRLLSKRIGVQGRGIVVGKSSLSRLERGDLTELFPQGRVAAVNESSESAVGDTPVSPYYAPLEWDQDADYLDGDDGLAAESDDWRYAIHPVHGKNDETIGYRVSGGDSESGAEFGSSLIGGKVGELTLDRAKDAAAADYASRYCEAEHFLHGLLDDWDDDDGPRTRRSDQGRIVCRVDESGVEEVEVVATLRDYGDHYDVGSRTVALSLRTILGYSDNGDREGLLDWLRSLIRREARGRL